MPEVDKGLGIAHGITGETLEEALRQAEDSALRVDAVLVVSPTYYGACSDIAGWNAKSF